MQKRESKAGKDIGTRITFIGTESLSEIRLNGKQLGLKGKKLTAYVEAAYRGDNATAAWVRHGVALEAVRKAGAAPIELDTNKAGDAFTFRFRVPGDDTAAEEAAEKLREEAAAKDATIVALQARLAALEAAAKA